METEHFSHHISRRFNEELERLRSEVLRMGGLVEQHLGVAVEAIVSGDSEMGLRIAAEDYKINQLEVSIDEECTRILATRGPTAGDLRLVIAVIKTITDLERIGDEAEKIARMAKLIHTAERMHLPRVEVKNAATLTLAMLRKALDSFARLDTRAAFDVVRQDEAVDAEFRGILRQLITFMMEDPRTIRRALDVLWVARALERIGDHAKNVCEYVVYMVHGKDIRHLSVDEVERHLQARAQSGRNPASR